MTQREIPADYGIEWRHSAAPVPYRDALAEQEARNAAIAGGAARVVPLSGGTRALADAVASTLSDPAELARLHEAGLERSKAFTWNAAVRAVASAYSF